MVPTREEFKKLWDINPEFNSDAQNFENTFGYCCGIIRMNHITPDGKAVDFKLIYERYKTYHHVKSLANEGVEEKFRKKENKILPLFEYLQNKLYMSEIKIPQVGMHFYFWDLLTKEEITQQFNIFKKLCAKNPK